MWTFIICTIVAIIISIWTIEKEAIYLDFTDYLLGVIMGILFGTSVGFFLSLALPVKYETIKETYNLETIQDGNNIQGRFFLGTGSIDGKMCYTYYYKKNNDYLLNQVKYYKAVVRYTEETPKVEVYTKGEVEDAFINNFALDFCSQKVAYIFYVPRGAIKSNFTLDAN